MPENGLGGSGVSPGAGQISPGGAPALSVVIPAYNAADFVAEALASVVEQGVSGLEIIVANDGSPDREALLAAIAPFADRVRYLELSHEGLSSTRNRAIAVAQGDLVAFLDADDRWAPGFLHRQLHLIEETGADLVYCDAIFFGDDVRSGATVMDFDASDGEATLGSLLAGRCMVVMSTIIARKEAVTRVGGFDPTVTLCEDFDLWTRMLANGARFAYHREPLAYRRLHGGNLSRDAIAMADAAIAITEKRIQENLLGVEESRAIEARLAELRTNLHLNRAKRALGRSDAATTRRELWAAFRASRALRNLTAALFFTITPALAVRMTRTRFGQTD